MNDWMQGNQNTNNYNSKTKKEVQKTKDSECPVDILPSGARWDSHWRKPLGHHTHLQRLLKGWSTDAQRVPNALSTLSVIQRKSVGVLSVCKSEFRSYNPDLQISNRTQNPKRDFATDSVNWNPNLIWLSNNKICPEICVRLEIRRSRF